MDIKETILDLITKNKEQCLQDRWYGVDEYFTGETDGYHNALVDLLNRLGMEHDEKRI
jgi:hypothetical protein